MLRHRLPTAYISRARGRLASRRLSITAVQACPALSRGGVAVILRGAIGANDSICHGVGDYATRADGRPDKIETINFRRSIGPKIEKAYGHKLGAAIKLEVLRVTTSFVMFEPFERAALPLAEAKKRMQSVKDFAGRFFSDLFSGPSDDVTTFTDELIDRHFNRRMPQLRELLLSLAAACNSALAEMENSPSHREGAAWDQWIRGLTTILDAARLPTAVSKGRGKSKSDSPSSFVKFVLEAAELRSRRGSPSQDASWTPCDRHRPGTQGPRVKI